ncbi:BTAD domain-containing putative transcriptional regulator [Phytomonospora sp. NPDC050363]|uniref:AfsR/SARP family transcriptional regulator n=1 Tax=Phytomonospora sp. NPDC050363 TaxID=3155642 RepID=UPI00340809C2
MAAAPRHDFLLLGPFQVGAAGRPVSLGHRKRLLLAGLLLNGGRVVSVRRLSEYIWDTEPPANPAPRLRTMVAELRRDLRGLGGELIVTRSPGYLINTDAARCDLPALHEAIGGIDAATDDTARLTALDNALALWRGPALDGLDTPAVRAEAASLDELRTRLREDRIEAMLALGRNAEVIAELTALTRAHPSRERPHGQLMFALFRTGRAEEALRAYRRLRARLADEYGIEPSAATRSLHKDILGAAPSLDAAPAPAKARPISTLPSPSRLLAGRDAELAALDALAERSRVIVVTGPAGAGKTTLAVHWAHRAAERFPDGRLYLNLRGFDPEPPLDTDVATTILLRALGLPPDRVPPGTDERRALLRSTLAGRRALLLLDNAGDAARVRALLPDSPGCLTLVTSRERLSGLVALDEAERLALDVLGTRAAVEILTGMLGAERLVGEPGAAEALAAACGHLPLALRIAGALLADRPHQSVAGYAADIAAEPLRRLAVPDDPHADVHAAVARSYASLDEESRRALRLSAMVPSPAGLSAEALGIVTLRSAAPLKSTVERLLSRNLIAESAADRFTHHDLVRAFGIRHAADDPDGGAAVDRLLAYYLAELTRAVGGSVFAGGGRPPAVDRGEAVVARAWLGAELPNIVAAVAYAAEHHRPEAAWRLADALRVPLSDTGALAEWRGVTDIGLAAAGAVASDVGLAAMHQARGAIHFRTSEAEAALAEYQRALDLFARNDHRRGEAQALHGLASVHHLRNDLPSAIDLTRRAVTIDQDNDDAESELRGLTNLAQARIQVGDLDRALDDLTAALARADDGDDASRAEILQTLAFLHSRRGELREAVDVLTRAGRLFTELGRHHDEVQIWIGLAAMHRELGSYGTARAYFHALLDEGDRLGDVRLTVMSACGLAQIALREGGDTGAAGAWLDRADAALEKGTYGYGTYVVTTGRAALALHKGDTADANRRARAALGIAEKAGTHIGPARALLAKTLHAIGDLDAAHKVAQAALGELGAKGQHLDEARVLMTIGLIQKGRGDMTAARTAWSRARDLMAASGSADLARVEVLLSGGG